jgi:hypothetical protein
LLFFRDNLSRKRTRSATHNLLTKRNCYHGKKEKGRKKEEEGLKEEENLNFLSRFKQKPLAQAVFVMPKKARI